MEIPLQVQVRCTDGVYGRSVYVLIDPVVDKVTHLVVRQAASPNTEYVVPLEFVSETIADTIQLRCSKAELEKMEKFVEKSFIQQKIPDYIGYDSGDGYYMPYVIPERIVRVPTEHLQIPPGELAVRRGTRVKATDGDVGHVDEFVINPENGSVTHMVMREGHLWGEKEVVIPLSAIDSIHDSVVFLKIDKDQISSLPNFPVQRRWP